MDYSPRRYVQYFRDLRDKNEGGTVTLRFTIGRDGRLIEASIANSSGVMALDKGMLDAIRAGSPYPPLPAEFPGDRALLQPARRCQERPGCVSRGRRCRKI